VTGLSRVRLGFVAAEGNSCRPPRKTGGFQHRVELLTASACQVSGSLMVRRQGLALRMSWRTVRMAVGTLTDSGCVLTYRTSGALSAARCSCGRETTPGGTAAEMVVKPVQGPCVEGRRCGVTETSDAIRSGRPDGKGRYGARRLCGARFEAPEVPISWILIGRLGHNPYLVLRPNLYRRAEARLCRKSDELRKVFLLAAFLPPLASGGD